jgi:hypothetical protein
MNVGSGKGKEKAISGPDDVAADIIDLEDSDLETDQSAMEVSEQEEGTNTRAVAAAQLAAEMNATVETASSNSYLSDEIDDGAEDDNQVQAAHTAGTQGHHLAAIIGAVPANAAKMRTGSIPRTRFADEYKSTLTCEAAIHDPQLQHLLANVNCSYLSTRANSPTLTELKQHAQSLIVLIKALTVSTNSAFIDNANLGDWLKDADSFHDGEAYDFLNDLNTHYTGPKTQQLQTHHSIPLNAVLNTVEIARMIPTQTACVCAARKQAPLPMNGKGKQNRGEGGHSHTYRPTPAYEVIRNICPLQDAYPVPPNQVSLPYAKHERLIEHANEILELLDHEYSAKGGLLSIMPPKEQEEDRKKAESTLLGQLILHMQHLGIRCHDLERLYANATDAMASEAVIPLQRLSRLGPDGRKGRELVYPQDRFVLVNCGEDVFSFLSKEFDKKDIAEEELMKRNLRNGTTGEALWRQREGKEYSRGITALDVVTRYYRIRGDEKNGQAIKTVFIIPAHAEHPGVKVTREMERQPTVVSVVKPQWPERQSILEMKHRSDLKDLNRLKQDIERMKRDQENAEMAKIVLQHQLKLKEGTIFSLKEKVEAFKTALNKPGEEAASILLSQFYTPAIQKEEEAEKMLAKVKADKDAAKAAREEAEAIRNRLHEQEKQWAQDLAAMKAQERAENDERRQNLRTAEEESARVGVGIEEKLSSKWQKQIQETQVIVEHLRAKKIDAGNDVPSQETVDLGYQNGASIFGSAVGGAQQLGTGSGGQTLLQLEPDPDDMEEESSGFVYDESDQFMDGYD